MQWLEFEFKKMRAEYIKLRGTRLNFASQSSSQVATTAGGNLTSPRYSAPTASSSAGTPSMRIASHRLPQSIDSPLKVTENKVPEEEVLLEETEELEEDEVEYSDEDEEEEVAALSKPPWAKAISEDVNNHIKFMRVPPILRSKGILEQDRPLQGSPMANGHVDRDAWQVSSEYCCKDG